MSSYLRQKGGVTEDALTGMVHDHFTRWSANELLRDLFARVRGSDGQQVRRLKRIVADLSLDNQALKVAATCYRAHEILATTD